MIDRAMELFRRQGYEGAHLSALVAQTGLNRFSLYKEFGGKAGLFEAALDRFLKALLDQYRENLTRQPLGLENVEATLNALRYGSRYYGCFMLNTLTQKDAVPEAAFAHAIAATEEIEALYHANLVSAAARGQIGRTTNLAALGKMLQTLDQGLHIQGLAETSDAQKERIIAAAMALLRAEP